MLRDREVLEPSQSDAMQVDEVCLERKTAASKPSKVKSKGAARDDRSTSDLERTKNITKLPG